ncbi:MAG TPA: DUF2911 domain-containing protein [Terracidiphilus sp.]|nr:DUF2911 domain-containing protein [Terracidiphilus sp.]
MKRLFACAAVLAATTFTLSAQTMKHEGKKPVLSPPATASATVAGKTITIKYASPRVRGREGKIFDKGGLIEKTHKEYPVWRAGANAATTLVTSADLKIGDLDVPAGKYTLFVDISNPDKWTLIVSKKTGEWGLAYDPSQDLGRVPMHMSAPSHLVEDLVYTIHTMGHGGRITLSWEHHSASVHFSVK